MGRTSEVTPATTPLPSVVLVGGGHAHVQVLRGHLMRPLHAQLTVVLDRPYAVYSGMVPGFLAGQYTLEQLQIDVHALAKRAGARVLHAAATSVDLANKRLSLEGRPDIAWDRLSLNVGSVVANPELMGDAVATRPIHRLCSRLDTLLADPPKQVRLVVVGAGAGGVELVATVSHRLRQAGTTVDATLIGRKPLPLPERPSLGKKVQRALEDRDIQWRSAEVANVSKDADQTTVTLTGGEQIQADWVLWVPGAAGADWLKTCLPTDDRGFVLVDDTLQIEGTEHAFAVGDCAVPKSKRDIAKAGVYAVRQGPVLLENLRRSLSGQTLNDYKAQTDFFTLLNLGDGTAIGSKWGVSATGHAMMRWKDRIDRQFMDKFQVLDDQGPKAEFDVGMPSMPEMEMVCGGCAAKVGSTALTRALDRLPPPIGEPDAVDLEAPDDVAAWRDRGQLRVANVDAFTAFSDDPYRVGFVGALNATSDLWVSGAVPTRAMALIQIPLDAPQEETMFQVLSGVRAALDSEGIKLVGGHSTVGDKISVGLAVFGDAQRLWTKGAMKPGDRLLLSRPIGSGVLWHADMAGRAHGAWASSAWHSAMTGNASAARVLARHNVSAVTDVTGFGLGIHLGEMLSASGVSADIRLDSIPVLPGAIELIRRGERSTFHDQNRVVLKSIRVEKSAQKPSLELVFDPQTAGGVLAAVDKDQAAAVVNGWRQIGLVQAAEIGVVTEPHPDQRLFQIS